MGEAESRGDGASFVMAAKGAQKCLVAAEDGCVALACDVCILAIEVVQGHKDELIVDRVVTEALYVIRAALQCYDSVEQFVIQYKLPRILVDQSFVCRDALTCGFEIMELLVRRVGGLVELDNNRLVEWAVAGILRAPKAATSLLARIISQAESIDRSKGEYLISVFAGMFEPEFGESGWAEALTGIDALIQKGIVSETYMRCAFLALKARRHEILCNALDVVLSVLSTTGETERRIVYEHLDPVAILQLIRSEDASVCGRAVSVMNAVIETASVEYMEILNMIGVFSSMIQIGDGSRFAQKHGVAQLLRAALAKGCKTVVEVVSKSGELRLLLDVLEDSGCEEPIFSGVIG